MIIICAWCQEPQGEVEPLEDKTESHGICDACQLKYFPHLYDKIKAATSDKGTIK